LRSFRSLFHFLFAANHGWNWTPFSCYACLLACLACCCLVYSPVANASFDIHRFPLCSHAFRHRMSVTQVRRSTYEVDDCLLVELPHEFVRSPPSSFSRAFLLLLPPNAHCGARRHHQSCRLAVTQSWGCLRW
jgi:hypothetical protein